MNDEPSRPSDAFKTLAGPAEGVLKVQGSKFLSFARPVETVEEALAAWHALQREFHDATHHCFAYRLQSESGEFRTNDDGEPTGTAGRHILAAIDHEEMTNVVVVVVRYFGGTKLGVSGLSRAYAGAAQAALLAGTPALRYIMASFLLSYPHRLTSPVMRTIDALGATIVESTYDDTVHLRVAIRASLSKRLTDGLTESSNGGVVIRSG